MRRGIRPTIFATIGVLFSAPLHSAVADQRPAALLTIGELTLTHCNQEFSGYCGEMRRPLDLSARVPGQIPIGFEFYPRTDLSIPTKGVVMVQEGGPGYSSTGTREGYLRLFEGLRADRDVLIIDKRGSGRSGPIDCRPLQDDPELSGPSISACLQQLGASASLYSTGAAADDFAAVLDALNISAVDFYGDSYGSYVGQVFAARHPNRLRSLVLDSPFPARGMTPWYESEWAAAWRGLDLTCGRSPSCRALGGRVSHRITAFLEAIRKAPLSGEAPEGDGNVSPVTLDPPTLFMMINAAGGGPTLYRELDAAVRAYFERGDKMPLLRLAAEQRTANSLGGASPEDFSMGLFVAVACSDYPVLFDRNDTPEKRREDVTRRIAAMRSAQPDLYAPFTYEEVGTSPLNLERPTMCIDWTSPFLATEPIPEEATFPPVPTLVLSGDLDSITSPEEGFTTALQFPSATFVPVHNLTHIVAMSTQAVHVPPRDADLNGCVAQLVRRFVESLKADDISCAQKVRPIRTVPLFAERVEQVTPATALSGNAGDEFALKVASVAAETAGDVLARFSVNYSGSGTGLRGGTFGFKRSDTGYNFQLEQVRWTADLSVSGAIRWDQSTGEIQAELSLGGPELARGNLQLAWNDREADAAVRISGVIAGRSVTAQRIAP